MQRPTRRATLVPAALLAWLAAAPPASAQVSAPLLFELPASTEALSLGTVFPLSGRDPDAVFYNPAAVASAGGVGAAVQRTGPYATLISGSGALPWLGGGAGVGFRSLSYDAVGGAPPDETDLVRDGDVTVSEMQATVAYAREVGPVRVGGAAYVLDYRSGGSGATSGGVSLGVTTDVSFLVLGLSVENLGPDLDLDAYTLAQADRVTLSGAFEPEPVGPLDMRAVAAVSRRTDGELIPAGGVDVRFWPVQGRTFIGRIGVRRVPDGPARPVTFGLAFWGDALAVEYAFQGYDGADDAHRLGVRWRQ